MTLPYIVNSKVSENLTGNQILAGMYTLDEKTDLLNIKEIIKDHYLLANFSQ